MASRSGTKREEGGSTEEWGDPGSGGHQGPRACPIADPQFVRQLRGVRGPADARRAHPDAAGEGEDMVSRGKPGAYVPSE